MFTGRPARGIVNRLMREAGPMSSVAPAFPLAASAVLPLRMTAEARGSSDFSSLWAGQNVSGCREMPAAELTRLLVGGSVVSESDPNARARIAALATAKSDRAELAMGPQRADDQASAARARQRLARVVVLRARQRHRHADRQRERAAVCCRMAWCTANVAVRNKDWAFFARRTGVRHGGRGARICNRHAPGRLECPHRGSNALIAGFLAAVVSIRFEKIPGT